MPDMPDDIKQLAASHLEVSAVSRVINESGVADYYQRYQTQSRKCLNGEFGKTAQYWATYMKMVHTTFNIWSTLKEHTRRQGRKSKMLASPSVVITLE